jgi:hypothetical protein
VWHTPHYMLWFDDGSRVWCPSKFILINDTTYLLHIIKQGTKAYPITNVLPIFLPSPACVSCYLLLNVSGNCNTCLCVCVCPIIFFIHMWVPFPPFVLGPVFWHRYEIVTARIHTETTQPQVPIQHPKMGGSSTQQNLMFRTCRPTSCLGILCNTHENCMSYNST